MEVQMKNGLPFFNHFLRTKLFGHELKLSNAIQKTL